MDKNLEEILKYTSTEEKNGYELLLKYSDLFNPINIWIDKAKYKEACNNLLEKLSYLKEYFNFELNEVLISFYSNSIKNFEKRLEEETDSKEKEKINKNLLERKKAEEDFVKYMKEKYPLKDFRVFMNLNGVYTEDEIELGKFKISNFSKNKSELEKSFYKIPSDRFWQEEDYNFILETSVRARDNNSAYNLAKIENEKLLDLLAFICIKENLPYNCSVGTLQNIETIKMNAATDNTLFSAENFLVKKKMVIGLEKIKESKYFETLNHLISKHGPNNIEKRILISLGWIRDSLVEEKNSSSLLKAMIALECLFQFESDRFMSPGITHEISEATCLILKTKLEDRLEMDKLLRKLYSKRSKITHEGKTDIEKEDCEQLRGIVADVIIELLTNPNYKTIENLDGLRMYLKKVKYF